MKNKGKQQKAKLEPVAQPLAPVSVQADPEPIPPSMLLDLAQQEPNRRELIEYTHVIRALRNDKKFTFREIAAWLNKHGVEADHNAVYREYTRCMHPQDAEQEFMSDEQREEEERV
jgi:hypothetical protein